MYRQSKVCNNSGLHKQFARVFNFNFQTNTRPNVNVIGTCTVIKNLR